MKIFLLLTPNPKSITLSKFPYFIGLIQAVIVKSYPIYVGGILSQQLPSNIKAPD